MHPLKGAKAISLDGLTASFSDLVNPAGSLSTSDDPDAAPPDDLSCLLTPGYIIHLHIPNS